MSAILELNVYETHKQFSDTNEDVMDHVFGRIREYKRGEEDILSLGAKLVKHASDLMIDTEQGVHVHDWISGTARDLGAALARREYLINDVKSALYLTEKLVSEDAAETIRKAVFG